MEFAGKGNRKPQIDVNISLIELDNCNPRLVPYLSDPSKASQLDLITVLFENFNTEEIALSLVENGYFDEEPIIIVPNEIPSDFSFSSYSNPDDLASAILRLIEEGKINFTVVEGNRRISTIKLVTDFEIRNKLGIDKNYPKTQNSQIISDITTIPCIIYEKREDVSAYLGVRHIMGSLKWEAYAKASYIADFIKMEVTKGLSINDAIKKVQDVIGDRTDTIKKQYVTYKLLIQAKDDVADFNIKPLINNFSLLTVAYNSPAIREYMGVKKYSEVNFDADVVPIEKLKNFENILTWIYGNDNKNEKRVLTDSRQITNSLSHVVRYEIAVDYLLKEKDLEGAYERTNGEKEFLSKKLVDTHRILKSCLQFAYKYKDDEVLLSQIDDLEEVTKVLKENLKSK